MLCLALHCYKYMNLVSCATANVYGVRIHIQVWGVTYSKRVGAVAVDVGANVGVFARYVANTAPNMRVICFEPMPQLFECLQQNLRPGVDEGYRVAVGEADGGVLELDFLPEYTLLSGRGAHDNAVLYEQAGTVDADVVRRAFCSEKASLVMFKKCN